MKLLPLGFLFAAILAGCTDGSDSAGPSTMAGSGGGTRSDGASTSGSGGAGTRSVGGAPLTGNSTVAGQAALGGNLSTGGAANASGGASATSRPTAAVGGTASATASSGQTSSGGVTSAVGGRTSTGGRSSTGGATAAGGNGQTGGNGGGATGGKSTIGGASAAGGRTSGTGGDTAAYQPCPTDGTACKILPLGDSITWGVGDEPNGGYRGPLFALAAAAGQKISFTGSLSNGPTTVAGQTFSKKNEGHSGWGISTVTTYSGGNAGIATLIPTPAFASASGGVPHIILLMIGTNDSTESTSAEMTTRLSALMDKIIAGAPNALLVVAKITPLSWASTIAAYNNSIPGLVQTRVAAGKHVAVADMNTGFNTSSMFSSDNTHPNATGYKFMADRWYSVIGSVLPK